MKIAVVVCLFDRHENLRKWLHCWQMCDTTDAELFIVNNKYEGLDANFWFKLCTEKGVNYLVRRNVGFETGIIQDCFRGKIGGKWDYLIFVTDDTLPMKRDFIQRYIEGMKEDSVEVTYMEASNVVAPHIRTTGFCISRELSIKMVFPRGDSKVISKGDCYHFEHTGGEETFLSQIMKHGKNTKMVAPLHESVLWDSHTTNFNRWEEWHKEFPGYI